ncbi:uncharacterized protein [Chamaea fasciata]|uniref:uncharacterized protein n=1 Tax=Chamaea fasciata TaxID=190680 RepID=UPI00336ADEF7
MKGNSATVRGPRRSRSSRGPFTADEIRPGISFEPLSSRLCSVSTHTRTGASSSAGIRGLTFPGLSRSFKLSLRTLLRGLCASSRGCGAPRGELCSARFLSPEFAVRLRGVLPSLGGWAAPRRVPRTPRRSGLLAAAALPRFPLAAPQLGSAPSPRLSGPVLPAHGPFPGRDSRSSPGLRFRPSAQRGARFRTPSVGPRSAPGRRLPGSSAASWVYFFVRLLLCALLRSHPRRAAAPAGAFRCSVRSGTAPRAGAAAAPPGWCRKRRRTEPAGPAQGGRSARSPGAASKPSLGRGLGAPSGCRLRPELCSPARFPPARAERAVQGCPRRRCRLPGGRSAGTGRHRQPPGRGGLVYKFVFISVLKAALKPAVLGRHQAGEQERGAQHCHPGQVCSHSWSLLSPGRCSPGRQVSVLECSTEGQTGSEPRLILNSPFCSCFGQFAGHGHVWGHKPRAAAAKGMAEFHKKASEIHNNLRGREVLADCVKVFSVAPP